MRVALISFEYPPAVAVGGIGTYAWHASHMLAKADIDVVVFAAGQAEGVEHPASGIEVRRVIAHTRLEFSVALTPHLLAAHRRAAVDLIEAPEIGPEGGPAFAALPSAARVVKLHTPSFLVDRFGYEPPTLLERLRFTAGALRRGRWEVLSRPIYRRQDDPEFQTAKIADEIAAPSQAIADILHSEWSLDWQKTTVYPLPYAPDRALLALSPPDRIQTIGFLGRLEPRKGILDLVQAIPPILARAPELRFRFIGPSWPFARTDMKSWILHHHPEISSNVEFSGSVTPEQVPSELGRCDAVVLPSRWENFPFACWEAMASGRAVIGSAAGGMAEIIQPGVSGLIVPPRSPKAIAEAILQLVDQPELVTKFGNAARQRITSILSPERVLPLQLASYRQALGQAVLRNTRAGRSQVPS